MRWCFELEVLGFVKCFLPCCFCCSLRCRAYCFFILLRTSWEVFVTLLVYVMILLVCALVVFGLCMLVILIVYTCDFGFFFITVETWSTGYWLDLNCLFNFYWWFVILWLGRDFGVGSI